MTRARTLTAAATALGLALVASVALASTGTAGTGTVRAAAPVGAPSQAAGVPRVPEPQTAEPLGRLVAGLPGRLLGIDVGPGGLSTPEEPGPALGPFTRREVAVDTLRPPDRLTLTPTSLAPAAPPGNPDTFPELDWGGEGDAVTTLQRRLRDLGFLRSQNVDGSFGYATWSAVLAFQKFEGLERTGWVDATVWQRLYQPAGHLPPSRLTTLPAHVEVDLERQIVFAYNVDDQGGVQILNASTGGNYWYVDPETKQEELAYTPTGSYEIYRRYDGLEEAPLGDLYRPMYFSGGWALHGSTDVPAYPASHGCVRLTYADMDWLFEGAPEEMGVRVHETLHPDALARDAIISASEPYLAAAEGTNANLAAA
jgi:peptidoglycan hydrolase-like protein with peptidoglycan-binding domain